MVKQRCIECGAEKTHNTNTDKICTAYGEYDLSNVKVHKWIDVDENDEIITDHRVSAKERGYPCCHCDADSDKIEITDGYDGCDRIYECNECGAELISFVYDRGHCYSETWHRIR